MPLFYSKLSRKSIKFGQKTVVDTKRPNLPNVSIYEYKSAINDTGSV